MLCTIQQYHPAIPDEKKMNHSAIDVTTAYELIDRLAEVHALPPADYAALIRAFCGGDTLRPPKEGEIGAEASAALAAYARAKADPLRRQYYGNQIFIRGLIEYSSWCKNDCLYCGLRKSNHTAERYRLDTEEILACCEEGYRIGFRTFVLQGGEDPYFTDPVLCGIISAIRSRYPDCAITLSAGERSRESYQSLKAAGADRYLLRHETADPAHYALLHPRVQTLENRMRCLADLRDAGFQVGCGFMVGSPGQSADTLAQDLAFIQNFRPEMCGIGPFIPHHATPFAKERAGSMELTLFLLSLLRLLQPDAPLPEGTLLLAYPQLAGLAPTFAYACGLTLQWAVGDTFTPLRTTATAFLVNAGFNALLLGYLHLDPWVGAASTLGATLLGCLLTFRALGKAPRNWRVSLGRIRIVGSLAHDMLMCALPLMVQVVALFAAELAARPLRTTFGVQMLQAWSLAAGIGAPVWLLTGALALALSVFAAQNFGMARYDRMQGGLLAALWLGLLLVGGLEAVLCILARTLAQPFVSSLSDATLVATIACMTIPFYALGSCADAIASAIRGAGESLRPAAIIIGGVCLLRTILLMTVVPVHHSILALVAVYPLTWGATVIALLVYYRHGRWLTRTLRRARRTRARHLHER